MDSFVLDVRNIFELSDEQFYQLCRRHPELGVGFDSSTCFKLPSGAVEVLMSPLEVDCSAVLPGFVLKLTSILLG